VPVGAFTVSVVDTAIEALVTISGELDATTCEELTSCLRPVLADSLSDVVIDLSGVEFVDSAAVHLLTRVSLELLTSGRRLVVANPSPPVVRLLSLTDLLDWFSP
jgi:anti-anti-sigma factor